MIAKLMSIATKVVLSILLAAIVGALAVVMVIPRAVHGAALTVLTGSMTPTIPVGSVVVVRPVDPGTLHVGDVITYQKQAGKKEFITHRVTAIHGETRPVTLTTKGDANRGADVAPVPVTAVRGKVLFHVPYLGAIRNLVSTGGFGLLLLLVGLVAYAIGQLISALRDRRTQAALASAPAGLEAVDETAAVDEDGLALQLLVARLPTEKFSGLLPAQAAHLLRADLLEEGFDAFTIAVAREPEQLDELAEFLRIFSPLSLVRSAPVRVPSCRLAPEQYDDSAPSALLPAGGHAA